MLENVYKQRLMKRIEALFPGCVIIHTDAGALPGIPDRIVLIDDFWAALEVKKSAKERPRPNQPYYVELMHDMSFAAFIYPENEEEVLDALQQAYRASRPSRVPESQ